MSNWSGDDVDFEGEIEERKTRTNITEEYLFECKQQGVFPVSCVVEDLLQRQWLDCNNRGLQTGDAVSISKVIGKCSYITGINMEGNSSFGDVGVHSLVMAINPKNARDTIVRLNLSDTGLGRATKSAGLKIQILEAIMHMPKLVDLDLSENNIGDDGMKYLFDKAWVNDIYRLRLSNIGMTCQSAEYAAQMIDEHPLYEYDISWNNFGPKGMSSLLDYVNSKLVRMQDEMRLLNVSHCGATDACCHNFQEFFRNRLFPNCHIIFYPNRISGDVVDELCFLEYLNMGTDEFQPIFYDDVPFGGLHEGHIGWPSRKRRHTRRCQGNCHRGCFRTHEEVVTVAGDKKCHGHCLEHCTQNTSGSRNCHDCVGEQQLVEDPKKKKMVKIEKSVDTKTKLRKKGKEPAGTGEDEKPIDKFPHKPCKFKDCSGECHAIKSTESATALCENSEFVEGDVLFQKWIGQEHKKLGKIKSIPSFGNIGFFQKPTSNNFQKNQRRGGRVK